MGYVVSHILSVFLTEQGIDVSTHRVNVLGMVWKNDRSSGGFSVRRRGKEGGGRDSHRS